MGTPNDSIDVTPGSGATIAAHLVGSKKFEVMMLADANGSLLFDPTDVFAFVNTSDAAGDGLASAGTPRLSIFNENPTVIVEVLGVWASLIREATTAAAALALTARLYRQTAVTNTATAAKTPTKLDTSSANLPADIFCQAENRNGFTSHTLSGSAISQVMFPIVVGSTAQHSSSGMRHWLWNRMQHGQPIVCRETEGVVVEDIATTFGDEDFLHPQYGMIFRVR